MDRTTQQPLTVAQAKQALRDKAEAASVRHYLVRHRPWLPTVVFICGVILGNRYVRRYIGAALHRLYCGRVGSASNVKESSRELDSEREVY